jgi:hypothetical protein
MKSATLGQTKAARADQSVIPSTSSIPKPAAPAQASPSQLLVIFSERCEARALLVAEGLTSLQIAVDQLQQIAVDQELVDHYGEDAIQAIMSDAFKRGGGRC